jgi:hypothetical protein
MALGDTLLNQLRKNAEKNGEISTTSDKLKSKAPLLISVFAAVFSINAFIGSQLGSKVLNDTVALNDTWSFYQAKSIKQNLYFVNMEDIQAQLEDPTTPPNVRKTLEERVVRYKGVIAVLESEPGGHGKKEIMDEAHKLEADRDHAKKQSPWIGIAGSVMQISIVLLTASILSAGALMFWAGLGAMGIALMIMAQGLFLFF